MTSGIQAALDILWNPNSTSKKSNPFFQVDVDSEIHLNPVSWLLVYDKLIYVSSTLGKTNSSPLTK